MPLAPNTQLGPYEIAAAIDAGGMGKVYRTHDSKLGRFSRKAKILEALNYTNIAVAYGLEEFGAALAVVRRLLRVTALPRLTTGDCLNYVKSALFCGILSTKTRELESSGAGQNSPHPFSDEGAVAQSEDVTVLAARFLP